MAIVKIDIQPLPNLSITDSDPSNVNLLYPRTYKVIIQPRTEQIIQVKGFFPSPANNIVSNFVSNERPTGAIDGSNAIFTTQNQFIPESVKVKIEGYSLVKIRDFITIGNNTIQLMYSPLPNEIIETDYIKI